MKRSLSIAVLLGLAACTPVTPPASETARLGPALPLPISTVSTAPSPTATTPHENWPTITSLPGLTRMEHPGFPGLVFLVDANRWVDDFHAGGADANPNSFLHYKSIPACRLEAASGIDVPAPAQINLEIMRGRVFHVYEYTGYTLYESGQVYFKLEDIQNKQCRTVLKTLLADVVDVSALNGSPLPTLFVTSTPLRGFTCDALPPMLHPGDTAYIGTNGVWLRSSPEVGPNNTLKLFPKHAPVLVSILDGPQCASGYAYWQVTVNPVGGVGATYSGWMAESNALTYVLFDWNP